MSEKLKVINYLREFVCVLTTQLKEDDERWGDTWLKRTREGQELRTKARYDDYFDQFQNAGVSIPWLKVVGEALICWIRDNHPEVCPDVNIAKPDLRTPECTHPPEMYCPECIPLQGAKSDEDENTIIWLEDYIEAVEKADTTCEQKLILPELRKVRNLLIRVLGRWNKNAALDIKKAHDKDLDRRVEAGLLSSGEAKLDLPPPNNEFLKEGDIESRVPNSGVSECNCEDCNLPDMKEIVGEKDKNSDLKLAP